MFPYISLCTIETVNKISGGNCNPNTLYYNKEENIYFKFDTHGFIHKYEKGIKDGETTLVDKILSKDNEFIVKNIKVVSEDECNIFFANPLVV